ncbi:general stress protein [Salsuginibacillus kocurii]|uniref:general stress protein n=1 Tax=Salsuginibacillus kocurii TaxID=427078 RepID=UPI00035DD366|nr:general stress protein [Salsuginibacillus kocurii]
MSLSHQEFYNDEEVIAKVQNLLDNGVNEKDVYILTHDSDRTDRLAKQAESNVVSAEDENVSTAMKNVFRKRGDELRAQFESLGYGEEKAEQLEGKLDEGKVIVVLTDEHASIE